MRRTRDISLTVIAAIFIILEIAALSMLRHSGTIQNMWISRCIHVIQANLWGSGESIRYYFSLKKKNDELAEENFRLSQEVRHYRLAAGETQAMDICTAADTAGRFRYIPATIVKLGNNSQHNYIIINKGSEDGVTPQSGIITGQGVIGIIDAVSRHYAYGISFKNTGMTVSARIGKNGPVGSLIWDGINTNGALLNEIPHHIPFNPGDTVYTSGFSSIFPPDIPIGTTGESRIVNGATYEIKVRLFEDFRSLRHVTVVRNLGKEEIDNLVSEQ